MTLPWTSFGNEELLEDAFCSVIVASKFLALFTFSLMKMDLGADFSVDDEVA